jgi:tetratricopeptide (TPR) repeat protein
MRKQSRSLRFQASLTLLLSAVIGLGQMLPANAHPYQIISQEAYRQEQAKWREVIKRDPKNPEPYLKLAASHSGEAAEGYWCETAAIAVYREAIAAVPPNAAIHLRLGQSLTAESFRCDEHDIPPSVRAAGRKEAISHFRKAIAIAAESASDDALFKAAELLVQAQNKVKP